MLNEDNRGEIATVINLYFKGATMAIEPSLKQLFIQRRIYAETSMATM